MIWPTRKATTPLHANPRVSGAPPWTARILDGDPNQTGCGTKSYAAFVAVSASTFTIAEGTDLDIGLRLFDCGGWIVTEWHDHAVESGAPTVADAEALALEGVARLRSWAVADRRAPELFEREMRRKRRRDGERLGGRIWKSRQTPWQFGDGFIVT